jgi:hypothetical protein
VSDSRDEQLSTEDIQQALGDPVDVPEDCVCAFVRELPYRLVIRKPNPECTVHSPDEPGEMEKERD